MTKTLTTSTSAKDWAFSEDFGTETLQKHFETNSLKGFGIEDMQFAIAAGGAILHYLF